MASSISLIRTCTSHNAKTVWLGTEKGGLLAVRDSSGFFSGFVYVLLIFKEFEGWGATVRMPSPANMGCL